MQVFTRQCAVAAIGLASLLATMITRAGTPALADSHIVMAPAGGGGVSISDRFRSSGYVPIVAQSVLRSSRFAVYPQRPVRIPLGEVIFFDSFEGGQ